MKAVQSWGYRIRNAGWFFPAILGLFTGIITLIPLTDGDIWWHLAAGRALVQEGWLAADIFTFTAAGQSWVNVHWLYQVMIYGIYCAGGAWGLVLAHSAWWALAASGWMRPQSWAQVGAATVLIWLSRYLLLARPLALTMLIVAVQVWGMVKFASTSGKSSRRVYGMLVVLGQILAVNVQGLFVLAPLYLWIRWPRRAGVALGLYAISALSPHGYKAWLYPFQLFTRMWPSSIFAQRISENVSSFKLITQHFSGANAEIYSHSGAEQSVAALLILTLFAGWHFCKTRHFATLRLNLAWLALGWLSLRNIPLALLMGDFWSRFSPAAASHKSVLSHNSVKSQNSGSISPCSGSASPNSAPQSSACSGSVAPSSAPPTSCFRSWLAGVLSFFQPLDRPIFSQFFQRVSTFLAQFFQRFIAKPYSRMQKSFARLKKQRFFAIIWLSLLLLTQIQWWTRIYTGPISAPRFPQAAVEHLRSQPPARVFNAVRYGGYISFHLYPHTTTFIDGRLILRNAQFYSAYLGILEHPESFEPWIAPHHIDAILLPQHYPPIYQKLIAHLQQSPHWVEMLASDAVKSGHHLFVPAP